MCKSRTVRQIHHRQRAAAGSKLESTSDGLPAGNLWGFSKAVIACLDLVLTHAALAPAINWSAEFLYEVYRARLSPADRAYARGARIASRHLRSRNDRQYSR